MKLNKEVKSQDEKSSFNFTNPLGEGVLPEELHAHQKRYYRMGG